MFTLPWWSAVVVAFITGFTGTLGEWWLHRRMHTGMALRRRHAIHHKNGYGQGWIGEFLDYSLPSLVVTLISLPICLQFGVGYAIGGIGYAAFSAYAHQAQHDRPELIFWMRKPVHYLHHRDRMWGHNFGITVDWWDRWFGTYKDVEYTPATPRAKIKLVDYFRINWVGQEHQLPWWRRRLPGHARL